MKKTAISIFALAAVVIMVATCFVGFMPAIADADDTLTVKVSITPAKENVAIVATANGQLDVGGITDSLGVAILELKSGVAWQIKSSGYTDDKGIVRAATIKNTGSLSGGIANIHLYPKEKFVYILEMDYENQTLSYSSRSDNDLKNATPISNTNTELGTVSVLGSWTELNNKLLKQCYYATFDNSGNLHEMLDSNDLTRYKALWDTENECWIEDSGTSHITSENTMFCIPTIWWAANPDGLVMTNDPDYEYKQTDGDEYIMPKVEAYAHTVDGRIYEYMALGVYESSYLSSKIMSVSDKDVTSIDSSKIVKGTIMTDGKSNVMGFYQWNLYRYMCYAATCTMDINSVCSTFHEPYETWSNIDAIKYPLTEIQKSGNCNNMGIFAGVSNEIDHSVSNKLFLENMYGNAVEYITDLTITKTVDIIPYCEFKLGNTTERFETSSDYQTGYGTTPNTFGLGMDKIPTSSERGEVLDAYDGKNYVLRIGGGEIHFIYTTQSGHYPGYKGMIYPDNFDTIGAYKTGGGVSTKSWGVSQTAFSPRLAFFYDETHPTYSDANTVTFNANGGQCDVSELSGVSVTLPNATKEGYILEGWYTEAEGGKKEGVNGSPYYPDRDITLYAHWTPAVFDITIVAQEHGTIDTEKIENVEYGTTYYANDEYLYIGNSRVKATADDGYLVSWMFNGTMVGSQPTPITSGMEFTCVFTITNYDVTINANTGGVIQVSGRNPGQSDILEDIPYGTEIKENGDTLQIGKYFVTAQHGSGYAFDSWLMSHSMVTDDVTIVARFTEVTDEKYTVVLHVANDTGGFIVEGTEGTRGDINVIISNVPSGSSLTFSGNKITINSIGRTFSGIADSGYSFDGWDSGITTVTKDLTIYVHFIKADEYVEITFFTTNGGSVSISDAPNINSEEIRQVVKGSSFSVSDNRLTIGGYTATADAKHGFVFVKWINENGSDITTGQRANADMTITAVFEAVPEPTPEDNNGNNMIFLIGAIAGGIAAVVLLGVAIYGIRNPLIYILIAVAAVVAVVMVLLYFGVIKF